MSALRSYEPSIHHRIEQLCAQLDKYASSSTPVDLQQWIHYYVFDVMTDLAWGGGGNAIASGQDPDGAIASLRYSLHLAGMTKALPWFAPILTKLPWMTSRTKAFRDFSRNMYLQRRSTSSSPKSNDVFHHLLGESHLDGLQLSEGALQAESRQVVTGGADTTVSAITYLFYQLLCSPHYLSALRKALEELPTNNDGHIQHQQLARDVPLLDACINEALRLEPPIPYQNQRIVPPDGITIAGIPLPGGTHIRTALYAIARDEENFHRSDEFVPERWLPTTTTSTSGERGEKRAADGGDNLKASMPFIMGPYHCVGRNFASKFLYCIHTYALLTIPYRIMLWNCSCCMLR
jgi:cytochrome P450 family 628